MVRAWTIGLSKRLKHFEINQLVQILLSCDGALPELYQNYLGVIQQRRLNEGGCSASPPSGMVSCELTCPSVN